MRYVSQFLLVLGLTAAITACGGGGGGGGGDGYGSSAPSGGGSSSPTPTQPTPTPTPDPTPDPDPTPTPPTSTPKSVRLNWTAPSTRADGSALSLAELSGYRVYVVVGSDASQDTVQSVSGGSTTSAQLTLAAPGTYTFAVSAIDQNGLESSLSNEIPLTLN